MDQRQMRKKGKVFTKYYTLYLQLVARSLMRVMQTHCQFFLTSSEVFAQFAKFNTVDDLTNNAIPGASNLDNVTVSSTSYQPTPTQLVYNKTLELPQEVSSKNLELKSSQNVDSPSRLRKHISSFFSKKLGGSKSGSGSGETPQSSFYVRTPQNDVNIEAGTSESVTGGASKLDKHTHAETVGHATSDIGTGAGPRDTGAVVGESGGAVNNITKHTGASELGGSATQTGTSICRPYYSKKAVRTDCLS